MAQLITIKPKPNSFKFKTVDGNITQFNKDVNSSDPLAVQSAGNYTGERFPNSRQKHRVMWSYTKRRWKLAGCTKNSEALNQLVKECKVQYPKDHPRYPDYIESADIFDSNDPFFKGFKFMLKEGEGILDKDHPKDKIIIMALQANPHFALSGEESGKLSNRVKNLIVDKNLDKESKIKNRQKEIEAITIYNNMNPEKRKRVAMAMGLIVKDDTDKDVVDMLLYESVTDVKTKINGLTRQDYFLAMANATTDQINNRYLIQKAKGKGLLKKTRQGYKLFGHNAGKTEADLIKYFENPDNQEMMIRLQEVLEKKEEPVKKEDSIITLFEETKK